MIWQLHIFSSGMLKKVKARLLTRAVQNSGYVFARAYRTATVREPVPNGLFQQPASVAFQRARSCGTHEGHDGTPSPRLGIIIPDGKIFSSALVLARRDVLLRRNGSSASLRRNERSEPHRSRRKYADRLAGSPAFPRNLGDRH